jgi:hypothetical protein
MFFLDIPPTYEKLSFIAALISAVVWLQREISKVNKKRDEDMKLWLDMYKSMTDKLVDLETNSGKIIEKNSFVIQQFTEVMQDVKDKLK